MEWIGELGGTWLITSAWLAGLTVVFGILVRLMPCNPGMYWWRDLRAVAADAFYWFLAPLVSRLGRTLLLIAGVGLLFDGRPPQTFPLRDLPLWQQCLAVLVIQDVILYWVHRALPHAAGLGLSCRSSLAEGAGLDCRRALPSRQCDPGVWPGGCRGSADGVLP